MIALLFEGGVSDEQYCQQNRYNRAGFTLLGSAASAPWITETSCCSLTPRESSIGNGGVLNEKAWSALGFEVLVKLSIKSS